MDETRQVPPLVHVLRHSFRPSEQLATALENFLPPESTRSPALLEIKSLGMFALDAYSNAHFAYSTRIIEAQRIIEQNRGRAFELTPDIEVRDVNDRTIDILMGVQNRLAMYVLTHTTKNFLGADAIPLRDDVDPKFSVYAHIHSTVPITKELKNRAAQQYADTYEELAPKHLITIRPEKISGKDQEFYINPLRLYE